MEQVVQESRARLMAGLVHDEWGREPEALIALALLYLGDCVRLAADRITALSEQAK